MGLKPLWSKVSGPTGAKIKCLRQLGWTWPHHTTFVTASGHEVDLRQICSRDVKAQAAVDSELALCRERERELLPCPLLEPVVLANKRAQRRPHEAPAIKAALGVIQAGWWTQEVADKAGIAEPPFCLKCGPAVPSSAQHRLWACPACRETRMDLPPTHQHWGQTAPRDKLKWERGLMHDPVEKYTPGRMHDGTIHVWIHPNVVGNSFGGKLLVDGSLMCKHGSQGGQAGWAVAQNPRDFPRAGLLSAWCHADLAPSATTYLAGRSVGTAAGHHLVGARSDFPV